MARNSGNRPGNAAKQSRTAIGKRRGRSRRSSPSGKASGNKAASPPNVRETAKALSEDDASQCDECADDEYEDDGCEDDEWDSVQFDANARDILGDFGLDDDEPLPEEGDFWFDDARDLDD